MKLKATLLILGLMLGLCVQDLSAQRKYSYWSVGGSVGISNYLGEFDQGSPFTSTWPAFGFNVAYHFDPRFHVRLGFTQGWASGNDADDSDPFRQNRNLMFRTSISEFSGLFIYDLFSVPGLYKKRPKWSPYVFTGLSVFAFNPKAQPDPAWRDYLEELQAANPGPPNDPYEVINFEQMFGSEDEWIELKPLGTEGQYLLDDNDEYADPYSLTQIAIPFGAGVRYSLTEKLDLRFEIGARLTFTDYLDDVSGVDTETNNAELSTYAPFDEILQENGIKAALFSDRRPVDNSAVNSPRGAPDYRGQINRDWYIFSLVSVSYIIDRGDICPPFIRRWFMKP